MKKNFILMITSGLLLSTLVSCKKYLEARPSKKLVLPSSSIQVLQAVLDNYYAMNGAGVETSGVAADDYYLTDADFESFYADRYRSAYLWEPGIFDGLPSNSTDWAVEYNTVYYANVVLDGIDKIKRTTLNEADWDNCKGSALLYRAKSFFEITQIWALAYDSTTADKTLGIPLRLTPEFINPSVRSTLQETYDQIISDLKQAIPLLPDLPKQPMRPSKAAAYAMLARTYLILEDFSKAKLYSDSCLALKNNLMDYNRLDSEASYPIQLFNPEVIMHSDCYGGLNLDEFIARIDTTLYRAYSNNDLRRVIFFYQNPDGSIAFKGNYTGQDFRFNGIATDELYLIRAECEARLGKIQDAMDDLNALLIKRWKTGAFVPYHASNTNDALAIVLQERRKELIFRMLRFSDIKRLNKEGFNIQLKRIVEGNTYILSPNDPRYALPIPIDVIRSSGIQQN